MILACRRVAVNLLAVLEQYFVEPRGFQGMPLSVGGVASIALTYTTYIRL